MYQIPSHWNFVFPSDVVMKWDVIINVVLIYDDELFPKISGRVFYQTNQNQYLNTGWDNV